MSDSIHACLAQRLERVIRQSVFTEAAGIDKLGVQMSTKNGFQPRGGINYVVAYFLIVSNCRFEISAFISYKLDIRSRDIFTGIEAHDQ